MIKTTLFWLAFLISTTTYGQLRSKLLNGKVTNDGNDVTNILIINLNSQESTITTEEGSFSIEVKPKDTLRFRSIQFLSKEVIVSEAIFQVEKLIIKLEEKVIDLAEVVMTPFNLSGKLGFDVKRLESTYQPNATTLNLPNAGTKKLSYSERLLSEADRGKFVYLNFGLSINTHKIINRISGRTKSLKERTVLEEKLALSKQIELNFPKEGLAEAFGIPIGRINEFLFYCQLQDDFLDLAQKNHHEVWSYLKQKSVEFKKTIKTCLQNKLLG